MTKPACPWLPAIAAIALATFAATQLQDTAWAQSSDGSPDTIQGQALPPPPGTDESKVLGAGAASSDGAAGNGPASAPAVPPAPEPPASSTTTVPASTEWLPKTQAQLLVLDKIYGNARTLSVTVGTPFTVRFLTVTVLACWVRPPSLPPDSAVFLQVVDSHAAAGSPAEFRGWIFQAEPALSGMSDPATDLAVKGCS